MSKVLLNLLRVVATAAIGWVASDFTDYAVEKQRTQQAISAREYARSIPVWSIVVLIIITIVLFFVWLKNHFKK